MERQRSDDELVDLLRRDKLGEAVAAGRWSAFRRSGGCGGKRPPRGETTGAGGRGLNVTVRRWLNGGMLYCWPWRWR